MKVFVYWNLHRKLWSIKALEGPQKGLVIDRAAFVHLQGVTPKVSQKGRERVLRERKKNVHAGLTGTLLPEGSPMPRPCSNDDMITYNPYKGPSFTYKQTGREYKGSTDAVLLACVDHPEVFVC